MLKNFKRKLGSQKILETYDLSPLSLYDYHNYIRLLNNPLIFQELPYSEKFISVGGILFFAKLYFYQLMGFDFHIKIQDQFKTIGMVSFQLSNAELDDVEISFELLPEYWGKGIMARSLNLLIEKCFIETSITSINAYVRPCNKRSINCLERTGFNYVTCCIKSRSYKGQLIDVFKYSLEK